MRLLALLIKPNVVQALANHFMSISLVRNKTPHFIQAAVGLLFGTR